MLLRGQNVLGYKHYPDDIVEKFIVLARKNGIDVFRIFDALNDLRNMEQAMKIAKREGGHVQGTISYTISPVHTDAAFVQMGRDLKSMGADSIAVKDMAGLISPYIAYSLVKSLKEEVGLPVQLHTHYTSGFGTAALIKAAEAGVDVVDCAISAMSMSTSQPPTETLVAALKGQARDTGLDLDALADLARKMTEVRKKYASFEAGVPPGRRERAAVPGARAACCPTWSASCARPAPWTSTTTCWTRSPGSARTWATRPWSPPPARSSAPRPP